MEPSDVPRGARDTACVLPCMRFDVFHQYSCPLLAGTVSIVAFGISTIWYLEGTYALSLVGMLRVPLHTHCRRETYHAHRVVSRVKHSHE